MRIVVLDYAGHIPQADLARNLAKLGHNVRHMYCSDYISGRGAVERDIGDPTDLEFLDISIKKGFNRYNPIERLKHELAISHEFWAKIQEFNPDHTIFSNVPLIAMSPWPRECRVIAALISSGGRMCTASRWGTLLGNSALSPGR